MNLTVSEDILSITELKRNTCQVLEQIHTTRRPVVLTVSGKAEAVLMDAVEYDKLSAAVRMAQLLKPAENDVKTGKSRPAVEFFKEFKRAKKISG